MCWRNSVVIPIHTPMCERKSVRIVINIGVTRSHENCTSPVRLFKTKADVRQHLKNWHTLEKCEQREMKLLKKVEKYRHYAEQLKALKDQNKSLMEENKRLKAIIERSNTSISPEKGTSKKPIPPFTQFLREQYALMRNNKKKIPFTECSKLIARKWYDLSDEQKQPYIASMKSVLHTLGSVSERGGFTQARRGGSVCSDLPEWNDSDLSPVVAMRWIDV